LRVSQREGGIRRGRGETHLILRCHDTVQEPKNRNNRRRSERLQEVTLRVGSPAEEGDAELDGAGRDVTEGGEAVIRPAEEGGKDFSRMQRVRKG
jgi:hypothetical protein